MLVDVVKWFMIRAIWSEHGDEELAINLNLKVNLKGSSWACFLCSCKFFSLHNLHWHYALRIIWKHKQDKMREDVNTWISIFFILFIVNDGEHASRRREYQKVAAELMFIYKKHKFYIWKFFVLLFREKKSL